VAIENLKSFDDFICPLEHAAWNCQANLICCFKVYDELKLRCLLYRQISRFGTFQDFVHVNSRAPEEVSVIRSIGHKTALIDILLLWVNSRQPVFAGKLDDPLSFREKRVAVVVIIASSRFCLAILNALSKPVGSL